jgi:putative membrane protein
MINRYTDHSANERTYLAWIRTAIAVMAFGFLIEKFNLFMDYLGQSMGDAARYQASPWVEMTGLGLLVIGCAIIAGATLRFFSYRKAIDADESIGYGGAAGAALAALLGLLGLLLMGYVARQMLG